MRFAIPVNFRPDSNTTQPYIEKTTCFVPQEWWQTQPDLMQLNALVFIAFHLNEFTYWEGAEGRKDINPDEELEYLDIAQLFIQATDSIQNDLERLGQSEGRLGQLLRLHWSNLEEDYKMLKRHVREFVLLHQTDEVYITQLSEPFKAHLASWRLQLGMLWLELEEQSR